MNRPAQPTRTELVARLYVDRTWDTTLVTFPWPYGPANVPDELVETNAVTAAWKQLPRGHNCCYIVRMTATPPDRPADKPAIDPEVSRRVRKVLGGERQ